MYLKAQDNDKTSTWQPTTQPMSSSVARVRNVTVTFWGSVTRSIKSATTPASQGHQCLIKPINRRKKKLLGSFYRPQAGLAPVRMAVLLSHNMTTTRPQRTPHPHRRLLSCNRDPPEPSRAPTLIDYREVVCRGKQVAPTRSARARLPACCAFPPPQPPAWNCIVSRSVCQGSPLTTVRLHFTLMLHGV